MTDENYEARAQAHLASIKRDMKRENKFLIGAATFVVVMLGLMTLRSCV